MHAWGPHDCVYIGRWGRESEQSTRAQVRTRTGERDGRKRNACVAGCWLLLGGAASPGPGACVKTTSVKRRRTEACMHGMASHRIPSMMVNNRTRMHACKAAATTTTVAARCPTGREEATSTSWPIIFRYVNEGSTAGIFFPKKPHDVDF